MVTNSDRSLEYVLGHSDRELERLSSQARMLERFTRQFFIEAEIGPGMRVLDVGSGAGDVAFLAASIVGPNGEVIGADRASSAVVTANARAAALQLPNVHFIEGDPAEISFDEPFDAIVGRLILMYYPDPVKALRNLIKHLRVGGTVAFQELDLNGSRSLPQAPLYDQCHRWITTVFRHVGIETQMGLKLHRAFIDVGLPDPSMRLDAKIEGRSGILYCSVLAEMINSLLPQMEALGVATAAEVGIDTLADRLRNEVVEGIGVIVSPSIIGAWSRLS